MCLTSSIEVTKSGSKRTHLWGGELPKRLGITCTFFNKDVFEEKGFQLSDSPDNIHIELSKEVEGKQVVISFIQKTPVA